ncbi:hypothetical protein ACH5RR_037387 [Cinchona calisaya]|uniref:DYW domain-containing protein n=1 Tax=Cinchona calisaya TaxID=153742 RepID=A0ABD2YBI7_9GENT
MYKKRAALVASTIPKVCSRYPIKTPLTLLRYFRTATERSDFANSSNEDYVDYKRNGRETNSGQGGNWNFRHFPQNPDGLYAGNETRVYGGNGNFTSANDFQQSSLRGNGNFAQGYTGEGGKDELQRGSVGPQQNFNENCNVQNPIDLQNAGSYNVGNENSRNYYNAGRPANFEYMKQGNYSSYNTGMHYHETLSAGSKENDESTGSSEDTRLKGTIQELDDFLKEGKLEEVVKVLGLLEKQGVRVDLPRYLALMKASGAERALEEAKFIHDHLMRSVTNLEVSTYNKILEMYCECGSVEDAYNVFDKMSRRNLTSWDTLITGLAKNGHGETAIELFTEFKELGLKPDGPMYLGVFHACKALLDITEGLLHFEAMTKDYGIVPSMEHYVSVVDMLGSTGHLDEALEFIEKMPMQPSVEIWETLMNLSRIQGNVELGDRCAELVELLDPSRLHEQSRAGLIPVKASDLSKVKEKKKFDGQNPLEVKSRVHEYRAGDRSDPDHEKLYALLWGLKHQMKEAGYIPETRVVLHDIDQESKEEAVLGHSERLAVAKGFLNTPARSTMRVIKNLRFCIDCHNAMKVISKLVGRELIIRDAKRFHHFKDGVCSCRDYW